MGWEPIALKYCTAHHLLRPLFQYKSKNNLKSMSIAAAAALMALEAPSISAH